MDAKAIVSERQRVVYTSSGPSAPADPPKAVTPPPPPPPKKEGDSVTLSNFVKENVQSVSESSADFQRKLSVVGNNQVVMKLIDPQTKEVVRQTPPEEELRLREAIRNATEKF